MKIPTETTTTNSRLRNLLRFHGLSQAGNKPELRARIGREVPVPDKEDNSGFAALTRHCRSIEAERTQ